MLARRAGSVSTEVRCKCIPGKMRAQTQNDFGRAAAGWQS